VVISEDDKEIFPLTPESKSYYGSSISNGAVSPPHGSKTSYARSYHPYPRPASFEDEHIFDKMMGRRVNDDMEDLTQKTTDVFLEGLKGLSQDTFRHAVRYKESVHARKKSRLECSLLEIQETDNLATLLRSLYAESKLETIMAERERNFFMNMLIDRQPTRPGSTSAGIQYSKDTLIKDKRALDRSNNELRLLQESDQSSLGNGSKSCRRRRTKAQPSEPRGRDKLQYGITVTTRT
ncbi:hypothetical protein P692DRAFT_20726346, partial [Suillus brevipes Sb2]